MKLSVTQRVFKTAKFSKDAKKVSITDAALCEAITQVLAGQADDLGGWRFQEAFEQQHVPCDHFGQGRCVLGL